MQRNDVEVLWRGVPLQDFCQFLNVTQITGSTLERREMRDIAGGLASPRPWTGEEEEEEEQRVRRGRGQREGSGMQGTAWNVRTERGGRRGARKWTR